MPVGSREHNAEHRPAWADIEIVTVHTILSKADASPSSIQRLRGLGTLAVLEVRRPHVDSQ